MWSNILWPLLVLTTLCVCLSVCVSVCVCVFQLQHFEERYTSLQVDLVSSQEKQKQALAELGSKEEELVVVKVELSSLQEKLKSSVEDVSDGHGCLLVCCCHTLQYNTLQYNTMQYNFSVPVGKFPTAAVRTKQNTK